MRVMKFGGTSVATAERLETVARLVAGSAAETRVVVVASALRGVTDRLAELVRHADRAESRCDGVVGLDDPDGWAEGAVEGLRRRHRALLGRGATGRRYRRAAATIEGRLASLARRLRGVALLGECSAASRDEILAAGERLSVAVVAAALQERGLFALPVDGGRMIATDSTFGRARIDAAETRARSAELMASLPRRAVPVVTGFVAADARGRTTTLGRGGSDYSASLLAAALDADRVEIWTDVDAVFTAEPHLHPGALPLAELSRDDAEEIAWQGGRVLHRRALEPLTGRRIPLLVRNTLRPGSAGTSIGTRLVGRCPPAAASSDAALVVTVRRGLLLLRLRDRTRQGFAAVEAALTDARAEICHRLQTRPDRMLLVVDAADPADLVRRAYESGLEAEHRSEVAVVAVVTVLGSVGGVAAGRGDPQPVLQALAREDIEPHGVWCGDRPGSTFVAVDDDSADRATSSIHAALLEARPSGLVGDLHASFQILFA